MAHRAGLAVLALVRLLVPVSGEAASRPRPAQASLSVSKKAGAQSCPSEKQLRQDVTTLLGYSPFRTGARRRVTAVLWATDGTFHARIQLLDARTHHRLGSRELSAEGPTCEALSSAMALAIALAINPLAHPPALAGTAPPLAAGSEASTVPARPTRAPVPPAAAAAPAMASLPSFTEARPGPALSEVPLGTQDAGPLPSAVGAPDAGPELLAVGTQDAGAPHATLPVAPLEADAGTALATLVATAATQDAGPALETVPAVAEAPVASAPPRDAPREGAFHGLVGAGADVTLGLVPSTAFGVVVHGGVAWSFASAEFEARWLPKTSLGFGPGSISSTLFTGALVGCASFASFGACGLVETGPFTSQGHGYAPSLSSTTWTVALGVRGQWDWVFAHPVGLRVHVDGLVNLVRTRLLVGPDVAWQAPSVALDVGVGLFLVF